MRALFIRMLVALAVVLIILIVFTQVIAQRIIRKQLTAFIKENCDAGLAPGLSVSPDASAVPLREL